MAKSKVLAICGCIHMGNAGTTAAGMPAAAFDSASDAPELFLCPISQELMRDPVICCDGFSCALLPGPTACKHSPSAHRRHPPAAKQTKRRTSSSGLSRSEVDGC